MALTGVAEGNGAAAQATQLGSPAYQKHLERVDRMVDYAGREGISNFVLGGMIHQDQIFTVAGMHRDGIKIFVTDILPRGKAVIKGFFGIGNNAPRSAYASYRPVV